MAATNENLQEAVAEGRFGQGLYYRLNVAPISLPPLREPEKDTLLLARPALSGYLRPEIERGVLLSPADLIRAFPKDSVDPESLGSYLVEENGKYTPVPSTGRTT